MAERCGVEPRTIKGRAPTSTEAAPKSAPAWNSRPHVGTHRPHQVRNFRTHGATDPLKAFDAEGAHYVPLADGDGDTHLSCVHLDPGATINAPSLTHGAALLVVHGRITVVSEHGSTRNINIHAGMGAVVEPQEPYTFKSDLGAILLIVEAEELLPHERGISTPERIAGQTWPSDRAFGTGSG